MSNKDKTNRNIKLKKEIKEMLQMLGVSSTYFKNTLPTLAFRKYRNSKKTITLSQQHEFLKEMLLADKMNKKQEEEQKEFIKKDQDVKSAMTDVSKEELEVTVKSIFDRV